MSAMLRHLLAAIATATIVVLAAVVIPAHAQSPDLKQHLQEQYRGKTLLVRGFYAGSLLHFDSAGTLRDRLPGGDWTLDGVVRIEDVRVSRDRMTIRANRLHLGWVPGSGLTELHDLVGSDKVEMDKDEKKNRAIEIVADLGSGGTTAADAALAHIFVTSQDNFADLVPDYWKPCVWVAAAGSDEKTYRSCRFSPEFLAIPGVALHSEANASLPAGPDSSAIFQVGHGISPPKSVSQRGPDYAEEARRARHQGTVILRLVVDAQGLPTNVHITDPLGCGLDAKAVQTVETWKFKPAEKDGQPVSVEIAVEVGFNLY